MPKTKISTINTSGCIKINGNTNFENKYLSLNQRKVIKCVCENGMTLKQTANKLNTTRKEIADLLDSILETLKMKICEKQ